MGSRQGLGTLLLALVVGAAACSSGSLLDDAQAARLARSEVAKMRAKLAAAGITCLGVGSGNVERSATVICPSKEAVRPSLVVSWYADQRDFEPLLSGPPAGTENCNPVHVVLGDHWIALAGDRSLQADAQAALGGQSRTLRCQTPLEG